MWQTREVSRSVAWLIPNSEALLYKGFRACTAGFFSWYGRGRIRIRPAVLLLVRQAALLSHFCSAGASWQCQLFLQDDWVLVVSLISCGGRELGKFDFLPAWNRDQGRDLKQVDMRCGKGYVMEGHALGGGCPDRP